MTLFSYFSLAQVIKLTIALGVLLGYAIQFFVPIQIMFLSFCDSWKFVARNPVFCELLFRTLMVLVTFIVAAVVPNLSLLLSLVGSVCCVVIAYVFPAVSELIILHSDENGIGWLDWLKNGIILSIALAGFLFGGGLSLKEIIKDIVKNFS